MTVPNFPPTFREDFQQLLLWRRDVRHFLPTPVDPVLVENLLRQAMLAPSVGFSQPWRWVLVDQPARRAAILENFTAANASALQNYQGEQAAEYGRLKLAGLREAPVHLAVFADPDTPTGSGLGRQTMPQTLAWSVVMAIHTLWLAAQVEGLGMGWVSILDPAAAQDDIIFTVHYRLFEGQGSSAMFEYCYADGQLLIKTSRLEEIHCGAAHYE